MAAPFAFSLFDPTLIFVINCALVPALKARDPAVIAEYATDPLLLTITAVTVAIVSFARSGQQAQLEPWEHRAANWYLWNASVFHLLLDWGVGTLKFLPTMQKNYQSMDTRYGCLPQHPCDGELGITRDPDPTVWVLTWIEALVQAPLAYTIFVAYLRGWAMRKPLEILLASCHITGTLVFMVPELYKGLTHVPPPPHNVGGPHGLLQNLLAPWDAASDPKKFEAQFAYFYFAFCIANCVWYIVPARLAWIASKDLMEGKPKRE